MRGVTETRSHSHSKPAAGRSVALVVRLHLEPVIARRYFATVFVTPVPADGALLDAGEQESAHDSAATVHYPHRPGSSRAVEAKTVVDDIAVPVPNQGIERAGCCGRVRDCGCMRRLSANGRAKASLVAALSSAQGTSETCRGSRWESHGAALAARRWRPRSDPQRTAPAVHPPLRSDLSAQRPWRRVGRCHDRAATPGAASVASRNQIVMKRGWATSGRHSVVIRPGRWGRLRGRCRSLGSSSFTNNAIREP